MDEFIGKDEAFVKDWLVRQGLEKPADVFKGCRPRTSRFFVVGLHIFLSASRTLADFLS